MFGSRRGRAWRSANMVWLFGAIVGVGIAVLVVGLLLLGAS
jgi:hypothetical protein